jgi:hypothetical protein
VEGFILLCLAVQNIQHDTIIFSLASLLCSTLIFNGASSIDEASIQNLGFIANLTKHIRLKSNSAPKESKESDDTSMEDFNRFFPSFIWVLRDFLLALIDDEGNGGCNAHSDWWYCLSPAPHQYLLQK